MAVQDELHWQGLNNLMEIRLYGCSECEEIPTMGHLPHLKSLYLYDMRNVKFIGSSFYGIDHCIYNNNGVCVVFPALQTLELWIMPKVTEWVEVESENQSRQVEVFPCLENLQIGLCKELRSVPSHFPCLKKLFIYNMDSGLPLATICGTKITPLTELTIWELEELESLPHGLFYNNQHLSELHTWGCPRLRELPDGLHTLNSLKNLSIRGCPSLKSLPDFSSGSFALLRSLIIIDCGELMNLSVEMLESCAPLLEHLQLRGLRSVMNMQMIIDCLHKTNMPRLTKLDLTPLPKFIIPSSTETPAFPSLRELSMGPDSESWDYVSFKEAVDGILLLRSNSLHELQLSGKEDWESLPDQLQHLSALRDLSLSNFGIQELPEWFRNLSSLKCLTLSNCKKLTTMPSVEAMPGLAYKQLRIDNCPLLTERLCIDQQNDYHGSEWQKISHNL